MPLYLYNGKVLVKAGKLATSQNCCCGDCIYGAALMICNINLAKDDNFEVFVNNTSIGILDFTADGVVNGKVWRTATTITKDLFCSFGESECMCASSDFVLSASMNAELFNWGGNNTVRMQNIQSNLNGNFGIIRLALVCRVNNIFSIHSLPINNIWGPPDGESQDFVFALPAYNVSTTCTTCPP